MSKSRSRLIMHIDMDAFFASVEQRDNPEFRCRPVVVGARPGTRGVVSTCSYEARKFGIRSAMPIAEAHRRCPGAVYLRPDMARYKEASDRVMEVLNGISPLVEPVSIDEAYLDISGLEKLFGSPRKIGLLTKERIEQAVGLKCSVGIGPNRTIAKLASESLKPDGLKVVSQEGVQAFLDPMPVTSLRGVGRKTSETLLRLGIGKVYQLRQWDLEKLKQFFGDKGAMHLFNQARGIASDRIETEYQRKSISKETTFESDVNDPNYLRDRLRRLSTEVGSLARREGVTGQVVILKIRFQGFETHTRQRRLAAPVDGDLEIFRAAWELFEENGFASRPVRLIGVGISGWDQVIMEDLFASGEQQCREKRIYSTLDEVREKFGSGKLALGLERK
jgi:DNA polymerase-4